MQYFQVKITNTSGFSDDKVWIIAKGKEFDYQPPELYKKEESFFQFDAEGKASFFHPTKLGMSIAPFAKQLSTFPKDPANAGVYLLSFPHTDSGRIYFSIGKGVTFSIVEVSEEGKPSISIADPAAAEPTDPNYAVIYDKAEFSYDLGNTIWFNTTAVDFISMPITITSHPLEEEKGITVGLSKTRSEIINGTDTSSGHIPGFNDGFKGKDWPKLKLVYPDPVKGTVLRIMAPNHGKDFNKNYLDAYLKVIWNYYKDHGLKVDCSEVKDSKGNNYGTFTGKAIDGEKGPFRFFNDMNAKEFHDINLPTSDQAFGCAGESLDAPNNTPKAVIVRGLTAAINVGLLPIKSERTPVLNRQFFEDNHDNFYKDNQQGDTDNPWYNLYSKILHSFGDKIYAFAYDDAVGQDSTLSIENKEGVFIAVKLNDMDMSDTEIPDPDNDDKNLYNITFTPGLNGLGSMFNPNDKETHEIPAKQATTVNNVKSPFKLTYTYKISNKQEEEVTYHVYVGLRTAYASNGQALGIGWGGSGNSITMALPGKKGPGDK